MDDGELYLKMDEFRQKPPPPIPRDLINVRRHSEASYSRQNDFGNVIASLQSSTITKTNRPNNYPATSLRYDSSRTAKNNNEPPPRPAKPFSTADLSNRVSHRHQNDEPPPRPPGKYDDEFFSYHQQNEAFSRPQYGPPVDNRPPAVTPDFAPHVLPRNNVEDDVEQLYLRIDETNEINDIDESSSPEPYNHGRNSYDGSHIHPTQFQLPPLQPSRPASGLPVSPKKPLIEPAHLDLKHCEPKPRNLNNPDFARCVPPGSSSYHRNPPPSPIGHSSRINNGPTAGSNYSSEIPRRQGSDPSHLKSFGPDRTQRHGSNKSRESYGSEIPHRSGSSHSQTSTSSSDNVDEERISTTDYQPRKNFQEINKNPFNETPFRPPSSISTGSKALPPMSAKPLPAMKLPPTTGISPRHHHSSPETTSPLRSPSTSSRNVGDQAWYRNVTRQAAVQEIEQNMQDGCFIVRPGKGVNKPYSLTVCSDATMYNLHIRRREDGNYALGLPKENERSFPNVVDLIEYYMETELVLAGNKGSVVLSGTP